MSRRLRLVRLSFMTLISFLAAPHAQADSPPVGDVNGDCRVYLDDHAQLVAELAGPGVEPGGMEWEQSDINADGTVDILDFGDFQTAFTGANPGTWSALEAVMSGWVLSLAVYDDGTGPALYAGGWFTRAGDVHADRVARWDGVSWSGLGSGMDGSVGVLALLDRGKGPLLYAGGAFTTAGGISANRVAAWDGLNWSALGSGMNGSVFALAVFDDGTGPALYAAGEFTAAGGESAKGIAKWNGSNWSDVGGLGGESFFPFPLALVVFDDGSGSALFAGGGFTVAGGVNVNYVAKWDGKTWSDVGSGMDSIVQTLTVFDDGTGPALYAGGGFSTAGGVGAKRIAKWDGSSWSGLGSGTSSSVSELTVFDDGTGPALYAGGYFASAGGVRANRIAKWDGTSWAPLGTGTSQPVRALAGFDDGSGPALYLFTAVDFATAGGVDASPIEKWTPAALECTGPTSP